MTASRTIPHAPPRIFAQYRPIVHEDAAGVVWSNQESQRYRDPDALTTKGKWLAFGIAAAIVGLVIVLLWWRLGRPL